MKQIRQSCGFTLIEAMVALVIVAVALTAALRVGGQAAANTAAYRDRLLARWVAANVLARAQIAPLTPNIGETQGEELMSGQRFFWQSRVGTTPNRRFRRVDIEVSIDGAPLAKLTGFLMEGR